MSFKHLQKHNIIGWDFDETLVNNLYNKPLFSWIENNQDKIHFIVTFRSQIGTLVQELENERFQSSNLFSGVFYCPEEIKKPYGLLLRPGDDGYDDYIDWKIKTCLENNITVLIDDHYHVRDSCKKYNLTYFHPDSFKPKINFWL